MSTVFMNLDIPEVLQTLGPEWASQINDAFEVIDEHDHSSGKGVTVKTAGISINANLTFGNYSATNLKSAIFQNLSDTLTGADNSRSVYAVDGDLYYTNSSGVAVQITDGASVVTAPSDVQGLEYLGLANDLTISPSDTFVFIAVDTSAAREITLPLASSVIPGRMYMIKDTLGSAESNNITISVQGSDEIDEESELIMDSPFACSFFVTDGVSKWYLA